MCIWWQTNTGVCYSCFPNLQRQIVPKNLVVTLFSFIRVKALLSPFRTAISSFSWGWTHSRKCRFSSKVNDWCNEWVLRSLESSRLQSEKIYFGGQTMETEAKPSLTWPLKNLECIRFKLSLICFSKAGWSWFPYKNDASSSSLLKFHMLTTDIWTESTPLLCEAV